MADTKLSALGAVTSLTDDDLLYAVDDPSGTPASKKITWANIKATLKAYFDTLYRSDGWIAGADTWSYSSADAPTFVISVNADVTTLVGVGDRIKLTQTTVKYFIVTAVGAYSGGATLVTVYGGTDYTLANAGITNPYYSHAKAPFGFPMTPDKWTVVATNNSTAPQKASPSANTWYGDTALTPTGLSLSIPIGVWNVTYALMAEVSAGSSGLCTVYGTLSNASNTELSKDWTAAVFNQAVVFTGGLITRMGVLTLASKATYYINIKTSAASMSTIVADGSISTMFIRAVCAYL